MRLEVRGVSRGRKARVEVLPDELTAGSAMLLRFAQAGVAAQVERLVPLSRRGGYGGLEIFALGVVYLSAGQQSSIRGFCGKYAINLGQVAALVDRRGLPTSASLSRALSDMPEQVANSFADGILAVPPGLDEVLKRQSVLHRDANGDGWHVFDFDPSTRAFRQRSVVNDDEHPIARRRAQGVPGHVGRKRGEIRQQDHLLQHAGSGLWAWYRLNAAGGSAVPFLADATRAATRWMDRIGHPRSRTVVRADGEFGHLAALQACTDQGLQFVARLARYHLFDLPEVTAQLATAEWRPVRGSSKEAADLGEVTLHDTERKLQATSCRVIVTRFRTEHEEPSHGILRDGFQYETFATTLPPAAWPPDDVAWLYSGRATIENSFAQQDRAYDIDRTFSFAPCGQQFFVTIALLLWNDEICRASVVRPNDPPVSQKLRPAEPAEVPAPPCDPDGSGDTVGDAPAEIDPVTMSCESTDPPPLDAAPAPPAIGERTKDVMAEALTGRDLGPGWSLSVSEGIIRCPNGKPLHPYHAEVSRVDADGRKHGQSRVSIRSSVGACDGCPVRSSCFSSAKQNTYKQLTLALSPDLAVRFKTALAAERPSPRAARRASRSRKPPVLPPARRPIFAPSTQVAPGPYVPTGPTFAVGRARSIAMDALQGVVSIEVRFTGSAARRSGRALTATPTERAATRLSWAELRDRRRACPAIVILRVPAGGRRVLAF